MLPEYVLFHQSHEDDTRSAQHLVDGYVEILQSHHAYIVFFYFLFSFYPTKPTTKPGRDGDGDGDGDEKTDEMARERESEARGGGEGARGGERERERESTARVKYIRVGAIYERENEQEGGVVEGEERERGPPKDE